MTQPSDTRHGPGAPRISRRDALRQAGLLFGGVLLAGCGRDASDEKIGQAARKAAAAAPGTDVGAFSAQEVALLDEIAETIVPETSTPGAKAAKVGAFMALMVKDCYTPAEQKKFRAGLQRIEEAAQREAKAGFMQATPEQRLAVLEAFDREAYEQAGKARAAAEEAARKRKDQELPPYEASTTKDAPTEDDDEDGTSGHFFGMFKSLALMGYFTSEIGVTQAQRYVEVPGRYDPCAPYKAGDKAWAAHA